MTIKISTEAKIGIIVLGTLLLIIWGINFLKGKNILKRTDVYYALYENVAGLETSAPVFINGLKVGLIHSINFDEERLDRLIVALVVEKEYGIPKGSVVKIASQGLISNKALVIDLAPSDEYHVYGDTLISGIEESLMTKIQSGIDPLLANVETTITEINSLVAGLNSLFDEKSITDLKSSINNTRELTGELNDQFSPNGKITSVITNLEKFSASLSEGRENLVHTISNMAEISDTLVNSGLGQTIKNLTQVTGDLHVLLDATISGQGSLGMLTNDESLYLKLVDVSTSMDLLLQDMKERPKRYVHFSLFGRKEKN